MSVLINLQPGPSTTVQVVHNEVDPPTLLIFDGTTTLFFTPAGIPGALSSVPEFAESLSTAAVEWAMHCRKVAEAAGSADPFDVNAIVAVHGDTRQDKG